MFKDMNNSSALEKLLDYAKSFDNRSNVTLTAERFLLAVIDSLAGVVTVPLEERERIALEGVLQTSLPTDSLPFSATRVRLLDHITDSSGASYLDGIYLQQRSYQAKNLAQQRKLEEVTPALLLECIFKEPDGFLKTVMSQGEGENGGSSLADLLSQMEGDRKRAAGAADESPAVSPVAAPAAAPAAPAPAEQPAAEADRRVLVENLTQNVRTIRDQLGEAVFGQENAISVFTSGYFQSQMIAATDSGRTRPAGTFLFAGPPGVGKTFLVKNIVKALGMEDRFKFFNMSEYADNQAHMNLLGYDGNYKSPQEGLLTGFVKRHPRCVLLFDEIEKAHRNTIQLFLQILDEGILTDSRTQERVSFKDALIFFTTNAGKELYDAPDAYDFSGVSRKVIIRALQNEINPMTREPFFPAAICSRFASGNVVMFNHMSAASLCRIAESEIRKRAAGFEKEYGIRVEFDPRVFTSLLFAEGAAADARSLRGRAERFFDEEILELFRFLSSEEHDGSIARLESIRFDLELPEDPEIRSLYQSSDRQNLLVFADPETVGRWNAAHRNVCLIPAGDRETAAAALERDISLVLVDLFWGGRQEKKFLDIEDEDSPGRSFFRYLREKRPELPVYILQRADRKLSREEQQSFLREGVRGFITTEGPEEDVAPDLERICGEMYQQASMRKLAASNRLVTYESGQRVSEDGGAARITLFDLALTTAVDAEDTGDIMSNVSKPNVRFSDVIGAENAKEELQFFIEYLKEPRKFAESGLRPPRGVLLYGPPGTGKTMLAKAMACEAGVSFISAEGNQFLKKYVGEGKDNLHELFKVARKYSPSILFIDEFEAIGKERRGGDHAAANGEDVLTALLTEMDGFHTDIARPVFLLAATNFDVTPGSGRSLDPALLRRFDSKICVDLPNKEERIRFIRQRCQGVKAFQISDQEVENLAVRSTGMSLSDLASVMDLSLRTAIRKEDRKVTDRVLDEAFETFNGGEKKSWDASELERTARHEAGHAFLCWQSGEDPSYVTVVARGHHGGYMQHGSREGKETYTKAELLARIRTSLGGRAAEQVYYGEQEGLSTGASSDLANATKLAEGIVCRYGMDPTLGLAVIDQSGPLEGALSLKVREAVNGILAAEMENARRIIGDNRPCIDALVTRLMEENHLTGEEIGRVFTENGGARETAR